MVKAIFLLPLRFNDGSEVPRATLEIIYETIYIEIGPYTIGSENLGTYKMHDGSKQVDATQTVWLIMESESVPVLREILSRACATLGQESIFLEIVADVMVEFIGPPSE
jgi:hypothetical protein